jgi:predicted O-linked N-acetylglucosamine transferase (SPINDLY family)
MDCIQQILQLNPTEACAYSNLGIILQEKGEFDKALSCYQRAIEFDPNFADAYNNAGLALQKKGELNKAIHFYQKAIGCNPNFLEAHCNLGNLFRDNDQFDEAMICYQKALFLNPNLVTTYDSIGICFYKKGKLKGHRIKLFSWLPSIREHLNLYAQVDIALDTFPYNGTTTSCEAMWMGVPVITLAGKTYASRVGESLLSNVGLKNLIANTQDEYVDITVKLASDVKRLQTLRERLRNMMKHSPLMDAKRFTANLEKCYRKIWENWCESQI